MNTIQRGIITLLKSAVTEQSLPLPEGFDLAEAYPIAKRHHMSTLLYDGAVRCGIDRGLPVMQKLFGEYCRALMISERQMAEVSRVFAAFEEAGIDYMPLKGCVMKARYPKPELRIMGDADVLIRMEQYDRIVPIMEKLGFKSKLGTDRELVWTSERLYLELHKYLFSLNNPHFEYFGDGWKLAANQNGCRYEMRQEDEYIYILYHLMNHVCNGGIGCRHILDLWMHYRSMNEPDDTYISSVLERLHLTLFHDTLRNMQAVWFENAESDDLSDLLTEFFFENGSWGNIDTRAITAVALKTEQGNLTNRNRLAYMRHLLFPNVVVLRAKYPILQKAPWMLPIVWMYRPFYKLLCERKNLKRHIKGLSAVNKEDVDARRELFRMIGLGNI